MITTSYDNKCKIWATGDWILVRTLTGHENKITSACSTKDLKYIITTSFDRTFRLWEMMKVKHD
jgi:U4/U6 small nuclear ribonucleoprotein PRP4